MGTCAFCFASNVSVDSGLMCQPCRTASAIAKQTKRSSGSDSVSTSSTRTTRYGLLGYYLLFNCVAVAFFDVKEDKGFWSFFGSLDNRFLDGLLTYSISLGFLYLFWRWMRSDGFYDTYRKGNRFARYFLWGLNLFLMYLIVDLFVDALPLIQ